MAGSDTPSGTEKALLEEIRFLRAKLEHRDRVNAQRAKDGARLTFQRDKLEQERDKLSAELNTARQRLRALDHLGEGEGTQLGIADMEAIRRISNASMQRDAQELERLRGQRDTLTGQLTNLRDQFQVSRGLLKEFSKITPITRLLTVRNAVASAVPKHVDAVIAHGMLSLPIMGAIHSECDVLKVNDCIEIPSFSDRAVETPWRFDILDLIDRYLMSYLPDADTVMTVSEGLAGILRGMQLRDVQVVSNYRNHQPVPTSSPLRQEIGAGPDDTLLISVGHIASGCIEVIEAISRLKTVPHLVFVGHFAPESYEDEVRAAIKKYGVQDRVTIRPPVPYEELTAFVSGADIGLIIRDPALLNNKISLPNRVFDYVASGVPFITPQIEDIAGIATQYSCGWVADGISSDAWVSVLSTAVKDARERRAGAAEANDALTWDRHTERFEAMFAGRKSVAIVGMNDLSINNRSIRIAQTLNHLGKSVVILSPSRRNQTGYVADGVKFHSLGKI